MWKVAQRLTAKPVKFGTIPAEILAMAVRDDHYKDVRERIMAILDNAGMGRTDRIRVF